MWTLFQLLYTRKDYADKIDSRIHFLPQLIKSLANKLDELDCR